MRPQVYFQILDITKGIYSFFSKSCISLGEFYCHYSRNFLILRCRFCCKTSTRFYDSIFIDSFWSFPVSFWEIFMSKLHKWFPYTSSTVQSITCSFCFFSIYISSPDYCSNLWRISCSPEITGKYFFLSILF